jgi:biopolymer transport protein ExbB
MYRRPTKTRPPRRQLGQWAVPILLFGIVATAVGAATAAGVAHGAADARAVLAQSPAGDQSIPTKNLLDMFRAGGPVMYPILGCSLLLCIFTLERSIYLRRGRVVPRPFVKRFLQQLREGQMEHDTAVALCEENGSPVARVFAGAVRKWGRPAVEVEQAIIDEGERVTNDLRRYLRVINGVATLGPLLGLLGTVTGMIAAFNAIANVAAMGHPELLAGGISEALITTAGGLLVAIPAVILYLYFIGRVDRHIIEIDEMGQQIVGLISAEALQSDRNAKTTKKPKAA